ncbi:MAG: PfkB family carbohydrate kinase [Clostridia bacterium]|nr:PfkB family carbohydrate kinase [Clostridia bacterium]
MKTLAFGEILWDIFQNSSEIGGAPFNFSAHLSKLGAESYILSSVGNDKLCSDTFKHIEGLGVNKKFVFISPDHPTGICNITCDNNGEPLYNLVENMAYDNIVIDSKTIHEINSIQFDAFYFGTLAQRSGQSRESLNKLLANCNFREIFCDLNIRQHYHSIDTILTCLEKSTILKLNRSECNLIIKNKLIEFNKDKYLDTDDFYRDFCTRLSEKYNLKIVIVTLDIDGAFAYGRTNDRIYSSVKPKNKARSTVGAGDSFSACFLYNYLNNVDLPQCLERANILGDYVVTRYEAIPDYPSEMFSKIR